MGITIVQKSDLNLKKKKSTIALVLSGGAITGGAFKLGGLQALNGFMLNRNIVDFDMFIGTSAGSFLATYLANGITTDQLANSFEGKDGQVDPIMISEFYALNLKDVLTAPTHIVEHLATMAIKGAFDFIKTNNVFRKKFRRRLATMVTRPTYKNVQAFVQYCLLQELEKKPQPTLPWHFIPNGIFTTDKLERSTRQNLEKNKLCNDFETLYKQRQRRLYIISMILDTAERVVFGPDDENDVSISKAMQASLALPLFYKPVRIGNEDYIDGALAKTTSMDVAIAKGADLIICYNPFRPFNRGRHMEINQDKTARVPIAEDGIYAVLNQAMRTMLHTRLMNGVRLWEKDPDFHGDIILIEPTEYDATFFDMNPMAFWERRRAATRGYESVRESIRRKYPQLKQILNAHGIRVDPDFDVEGGDSGYTVKDAA